MLGSAPGRVIDELTVPFARPRQRRRLAVSPEFAALRERIDGQFRQDVLERIDSEEFRTAGDI
jgi:NitT/TauT family transport system ATP-binding protein